MLEGDLRSEAASILESIYEERGDWPRLIHALEILSGAEGDLEKRVALKRKAARISAERVNDAAHAFAVLASALRDDPALAETRDEIERIAEGSGGQEELVALYGELAASLTDAVLARDYWMRIAGIDVLRLTVFRHVLLDWWQSPSPTLREATIAPTTAIRYW